MLACQKGHQSIAIHLLEKGADKQLQNEVSLFIIRYVILPPFQKKKLYYLLLKLSTLSIIIHL